MKYFRRLLLASCVSAALPAWADGVQGLILPLKQVSLSSPVLQDVIDAVMVEEGQTVTEGQTVVELRKEREELAVQEAQKILENAQFVEHGYEALALEAISSKDLYLKARTDMELAKIRLALAQEQLKEKTIRSTLAGIVVKKYKEAGEGVDRVEKLINVVDIDKVFAQFYLSPRITPTLQLKQPITIHVPDLNNAAFTGQIDFISPSLDAGSGLVRVKVLVDNPDHKMKANMKAEADFTKNGRD